MSNIDYEKIEYIQNLILTLLQKGGFKAKVEYEQSLIKGLVFNISVDSTKQLIGKQGRVLIALEHLIFAMVNRHFGQQDEPVRFTIDIDDYRRKREYQLKQQVKDAVLDLKQGQEKVVMPAMPRHERKFVHNYIQEQYPHLNTVSTGEEPRRQIVLTI